MTYKTDQNGIIYVSFTPVNLLTDVVTRLYLSINDNLTNSCLINCSLYNEGGANLYQSSFIFDGSNYANWSGDNDTIFNYVANQLNLNLEN
jgi:hypothetical protein